MALETEFLEMASTTVTIEPLSTDDPFDAYGAPQFDGSPVTFDAYVEPDNQLIRGTDGRELLTKFLVIVMSSSASIGTQDRITAAGSTELNIAQVMPRNDDEGQHHVELLLT